MNIETTIIIRVLIVNIELNYKNSNINYLSFNYINNQPFELFEVHIYNIFNNIDIPIKNKSNQ